MRAGDRGVRGVPTVGAERSQLFEPDVSLRPSPRGQAPGFPKLFSGWNLWAPSAGDLLSNGHTDIVTVSREGYVFAGSTQNVLVPLGTTSFRVQAVDTAGNLGRTRTVT